MAREENASYEGKGQRGLSRAGLINTIYPVGSIYMSINPTNPSEYFGGSWTLLHQDEPWCVWIHLKQNLMWWKNLVAVRL